MNNIFSFDRFLKVLKYDLKMRVPAIGTMFLVFLVLPHVLHFVMNYDSVFRESLRVELIGTMLFCISFFAPFSIYSVLREKQGAGSYIMIPASGLEKFASMVLICSVILPIVFCVGSLIVDSLFTLVFRNMYGGFISLQQADAKFELGRVFVTVFSIVGAALLGNAVFKGKASFKTILCLLVIAYLWGAYITGFIFDHVLDEGNIDQSVLMSKGNQLQQITVTVYAVVSILFYCLTYWRIKKIQIS